MASDPFSIWTDQVLTVASLQDPPVAGTQYTLGSTPEQNNGPTSRDSIVLNVSYSLITLDITDGSPPFRIGALLETKESNGEWVPIAYQFSSLRNSEDAPLRIIRLQPNISDFNAGIDDSVYPVNKEIARISRQQGTLPDASWRVCIVVADSDPQGINGLVSCKVSISGERYDSAG